MRRTNLSDAPCPIARSLDALGDWWTLLIVRDALRGSRRFSDFQKNLGLARNILSARLRQMVANGLLEQRPAQNGGARGEYHLTEKGKRLRLVIAALRQWGEDNLFEDEKPSTIMIETATGRPIGRLFLTSEDGRLLRLDEVSVVARPSDSSAEI
jgi:DNA-binding HxlR family transcriptional regulator